MMTSEGAKLGIPQGQLSGDRANLVAWLKVRVCMCKRHAYVGQLSGDRANTSPYLTLPYLALPYLTLP